eukprot:gnl/TRDRNA2_/TRDRNA2_194595_c0_seq1.p1 gnl/TRDRNA2_/TRDRNA2_194595_c0~~gnl/TRDRNA2_/TRDRNA2_194595_c0_seq1.p1  ORF type:complete len:166 (+),score=18.88 gnl/TRDRNA2_/TRDRNA2_194595_c0_seq1:37-498(+)
MAGDHRLWKQIVDKEERRTKGGSSSLRGGWHEEWLKKSPGFRAITGQTGPNAPVPGEASALVEQLNDAHAARAVLLVENARRQQAAFATEAQLNPMAQERASRTNLEYMKWSPTYRHGGENWWFAQYSAAPPTPRLSKQLTSAGVALSMQPHG